MLLTAAKTWKLLKSPLNKEQISKVVCLCKCTHIQTSLRDGSSFNVLKFCVWRFALCVSMYVQMYVSMCIQVEASRMGWVSTSSVVHFNFWDSGPHWTWSSPFWLGLLAHEIQRKKGIEKRCVSLVEMKQNDSPKSNDPFGGNIILFVYVTEKVVSSSSKVWLCPHCNGESSDLFKSALQRVISRLMSELMVSAKSVCQEFTTPGWQSQGEAM